MSTIVVTNLNFNQIQQDPPIYHDIFVSLEEILTGTTKNMKIIKTVISPDRRSTHLEEKILSIQIRPGWKQGTKITFPKEGDQFFHNIPADIVFVIKDKPHLIFERDGSDLIFTAKIILIEVGSWLFKALLGTVISVPTLEKQVRFNLTK